MWNGDTLVSDALMAKVVANERAGICVTVDRKDRYDDDDMKVVEEGGRLKAIGKRIAEGVNAESIGLLAFRAGGAERFREAIEAAMRTAEGTTIWYLRVIHHLAQASDVWTLDISGRGMGRGRLPARRRGGAGAVRALGQPMTVHPRLRGNDGSGVSKDDSIGAVGLALAGRTVDVVEPALPYIPRASCALHSVLARSAERHWP